MNERKAVCFFTGLVLLFIGCVICNDALKLVGCSFVLACLLFK